MSSIPAAGATPVAAGTTSINPQLAQIVAQLPADQQQAAMAKIAALSPEQQTQLLAEVARQTSAQQTTAAAATTGADAATLGASALQPPNRMSTILKNVAIFGGIGAALGFGASFFTLPIVGQVAAPIAAAVGGGIGVVAGLIKGFMTANKEQAEYDTAVAQEQEAAVAAQQQAAAAAAAAPAEDAPVDDAEPVEPVVVRRKGSRSRGNGERYTVVKGDNLSAIAARHGLTWQELYKANREAVGSNPHLIHPGLKLKIPAA